jgi:GTP-binding protein YchF
MRIGIIGLPHSGKTTVFNAIAARNEIVGNYGSGTKTNVATSFVPDPRLDALAAIYKPKKTTYASVEYLDFPAGNASFGKGDGLEGRFLNELGAVDALLHVVRAFENESVPHPEETIDFERDRIAMDLELAFADLAMIERRLERIEPELRSLKQSERGPLLALDAVLKRLQQELEQEVPIRAIPLSQDETRLLQGTSFLTSLPLLEIINVDEETIGKEAPLMETLQSSNNQIGRAATTLSAKFDMELNSLSEHEAKEFQEDMGGLERGYEGVLRLSYELLGLISFLTVGEDECRAWTIAEGLSAPKAAGQIHSDLERGFIRAEVIAWDVLLNAKTEVEAKRQGLIKTEGKDYIVKDGDVMNILFNV